MDRPSFSRGQAEQASFEQQQTYPDKPISRHSDHLPPQQRDILDQQFEQNKAAFFAGYTPS
jgi:hypothetical protein